jgi:hypothetical protein
MAKSKKSTGKAKKAAKGKKPAKAKRPAKPKKAVKAKKPAKRKAKKSKPAKRGGMLRGPKGRSGGGGVTLKGITFTDDSPGPVQSVPTRILVNAWSANQPNCQIGTTQQNDFLGGLTSPTYQDFTSPFLNVPLSYVGVIVIKQGSPAMPYQPYPFRYTGTSDTPTLSVTLTSQLTISVELD